MLNKGEVYSWSQGEDCRIWNYNLGLDENGRYKLLVSIVQFSGRFIRNISENLEPNDSEEKELPALGAA